MNKEYALVTAWKLNYNSRWRCTQLHNNYSVACMHQWG